MTPAKLHLILDAVLLCLVVALGLALQRERSSTTSLKLEQTTLESRLAESVSALTQTDTQADTTHTTTTTLKPDGTKVVEVKVEAKHATEVEHKQTDISTQTQVETKLAETKTTSTPMPDALSRYSLELLWNPMALSYAPSALTLGARLGNLPLWAEAGWLPQTHAYLLGLRIEL